MGTQLRSRHPQVGLPLLLTGNPDFPDPRLADEQGLVAVGGDFSVPRLLAAYRQGIFPWSANPITWWSPDPRGIIELKTFHIPRSLKRHLQDRTISISLNRSFETVIGACAQPSPKRETTWITREFIEAYKELHQARHAHSLEVWRGRILIGGIYGVTLGGLFAGESMFHHETGASKVALVRLVEHLEARGFTLFDVQMLTPVTRQMGGVEIRRVEYLDRLDEALKKKCQFGECQPGCKTV